MNNLHALYQAQGALLRRHRRQAGIDQVSWAARLGVHQSRVSFMERGSRATLAAHAAEAARQLGMAWDDIQREADRVVARARTAARAIGISDIDGLDPEVRYDLVRFVAETLTPARDNQPEPDLSDVCAWVAYGLVEDEATRRLILYSGIRADRQQEAFEDLTSAHNWRWASWEALRERAEEEYRHALEGPHSVGEP